MSKISDTAGNPRGREKERIGSVEDSSMTAFVRVPTTTAPAVTVERHCDECGAPFRSKNAEAARMMTAGKLRVCDTCRRKGARTQLPYSEYLKSDGWKARRAAALKRADNHCAVCHTAAGLEVHHNTYERLGHERAADLVVLCRTCHQLFHDSGELKY